MEQQEIFDNDSVKKNIEQYKCKGCGANMHYDPKTRKLLCSHCGSTEDIVFDNAVTERDFCELEAHKFKRDDKVKVVTCKNCGATEILKNDEVATKCPFCDSPLVVETEELDSVKPDSMIPFLIDKKTAKQKCDTWLKKRWFAASKFKKELRLHSPDGVYYPIWTFDSDTETSYVGRLGQTYTTTRRDEKGNTHTETHVRWFNVSGKRQNYFDDIVINASAFIDGKTMQKLQPFPQTNYVVYNTQYLAGYLANHYTVDPFTAFGIAEDRMKETIKKQIISSYNADRVDYLKMTLNHKQKSFKSMFVPVYMTGAKFKDKLYKQFINGATGKITGKYPKSVFKIILMVILGLAAVAGLCYLYYKYMS